MAISEAVARDTVMDSGLLLHPFNVFLPLFTHKGKRATDCGSTSGSGLGLENVRFLSSLESSPTPGVAFGLPLSFSSY